MNKQVIVSENSIEYLVSYDANGNEKKRYCLETNPEIWAPKHPGDICPEFMLRFCQAKGLADLEWYVKLLDQQISKEKKKKITGEVIQIVKRKRTPSEVKQEFISKYFSGMKRVKDEAYQGHASKAKKILEDMKASAPAQAAPATPAKNK